MQGRGNWEEDGTVEKGPEITRGGEKVKKMCKIRWGGGGGRVLSH